MGQTTLFHLPHLQKNHFIGQTFVIHVLCMHPYAISSEMQMNPIACCDINKLDTNNWMQRLIQVLCSQLPTCMAVMVSVHRKHRESRAWLSVEWLKTACSNIPLNSQRRCLSVTPIASWYFDVSWFLCLCLAVVPVITIYHRVSQHIHVFSSASQCIVTSIWSGIKGSLASHIL